MRLFFCLLLLAPLALYAQPAVVPWGALDDDTTNWSEANCLAHLSQLVCRYPNDIGSGFTFEVQVNARPVGDWEADGWSLTGFRVFSLDDDTEGGGPEHLVIANNDAVSNGLGVAYWTLYVLDATEPALPLASLIPVQEFGADGESFVPMDGGLVLWATEWLQGPDPSEQRDEGLYFIGRPFRIADGRLVPAMDLPIRARRFLNRFAAERGNGPPDPVVWLTHPNTESRPVDPYLLGGETEAFRGVVESVTSEPADYGRTNWVVHIRPETGDPVAYTYEFGYSADLEHPFRYVGDGVTGRLYPEGYRLADPAAWLHGRAVRVATYAGDREPRRVLWLD